MGEQPHPRWAGDALAPRVVSTPATYDSTPAGPVRRAPLYDGEGALLGHVWTDGQRAAGYLDREDAGPAGRRAGATVWAILRDAHRIGRPAADVLDPTLYADEGFELRP